MTALICLTYDDALPVHREFVAPELSKRGLRGTFYIPAARDDLYLGLDGWRKVAEMGHELGNHSCWHPCRTRADWEWKPPYRLEEYTRGRMHDELLLANRVLHLIDGRTERSYGATCSDTTCGPEEGESFIGDIRDLFTIVRSGQRDRPMMIPASYVVPQYQIDHLSADRVITVIGSMRSQLDPWILLGIHGVGAGTHNSFIEVDEHQKLIDWIATQREWLEEVTVLEFAHRWLPISP